jgi:hypothetical protein
LSTIEKGVYKGENLVYHLYQCVTILVHALLTKERTTMARSAIRTIKEDTIALLTRKRPMTYDGIVSELHRRHPDAATTKKTVQWYASRLRADGQTVNVRRDNERRNWSARAKGNEGQRAN